MVRCQMCGKKIPPSRKDYPTCSTECGQILTKQKRKEYAANEKKARWQATRKLNCIVCGKVLGHPGQYCKEHRPKRQRRKEPDVQSNA